MKDGENSKIHLDSHASDEGATLDVALRLAATLIMPRHRPYTIALSGGRSAARLFEIVCERLFQPVHSSAHFFWADERCLPLGHTDTNFHPAQSNLFRPLEVPEAQIHRIQGELGNTEAARAANEEFHREAPERRFDLVLLGMGEDGHIASLFPGRPIQDVATHGDVFIPVTNSPKPPPERVSLTYEAIANAGEVWVLVTGSRKRQILHRALDLDESLPLGRILSERRSTNVFACE